MEARSVTRGTTQPVIVDLPEGMTSQDVAELYLTFKQNRTELFTKTLDDMEYVETETEAYYRVRLTQADTLKLSKCGNSSTVNVQARLLTVLDDALASDEDYAVQVKDILKDGEI